jgi:CBS domain containing-hemolysin-like protein
VPLEENKYLVRCSADTYDFFEFFNLSENDIEKLPTTVNGWIVHMLGKIPKCGDSFSYKNLTVTVSKAERRRVFECMVEV